MLDAEGTFYRQVIHGPCVTPMGSGLDIKRGLIIAADVYRRTDMHHDYMTSPLHLHCIWSYLCLWLWKLPICPLIVNSWLSCSYLRTWDGCWDLMDYTWQIPYLWLWFVGYDCWNKLCSIGCWFAVRMKLRWFGWDWKELCIAASLV